MSRALASGSIQESVLEVRDLSVVFRTGRGLLTAVDGISFDLYAGETVGLVGESGCGKSVTAMALMGLLPRTRAQVRAGSIRLCGETLSGLGENRLRQLRGRVASMIFQEPMTALNPVYTIGNQLVEILRRHLAVTRRQALERALDLLEMVGIPAPQQRFAEYPHQLSGGQRQRVMIAMALACNPQLLIADEPTTALDVTTQAQILELIVKLQQEFGTAVLLITHDLGVVGEVCRRAMVMYCGKLVESAPVKDLFTTPRHPYSQGLLNAMPRIRPDRLRRLPSIPGAVPDPFHLPAGCRFVNRCTHAIGPCSVTCPPVVTDGERSFTCYRPVGVS